MNDTEIRFYFKIRIKSVLLIYPLFIAVGFKFFYIYQEYEAVVAIQNAIQK